MKSSLYSIIKKSLFLTSLFFISWLYSDNSKYIQYNNHGTVGLINSPTARFFNEGIHGVTVYDGTPDQKVTLSSNP